MPITISLCYSWHPSLYLLILHSISLIIELHLQCFSKQHSSSQTYFLTIRKSTYLVYPLNTTSQRSVTTVRRGPSPLELLTWGLFIIFLMSHSHFTLYHSLSSNFNSLSLGKKQKKYNSLKIMWFVINVGTVDYYDYYVHYFNKILPNRFDLLISRNPIGQIIVFDFYQMLFRNLWLFIL